MTEASSGPDTFARATGELDRLGFHRAVCAVIDRWAQSLPEDTGLRLARMSDLPALHAVNTRAIQELGRDGLFMPMPEDFLGEMVSKGIILLLERNGKQRGLGYSIAVPAGRDRPPFISESGPGRTGLLFGTALDPALRGQNWHSRLILLRKEIFAEAGFASAQSTVSPYNTVSMANLINAGFHVSGLKVLLDGHPRFLLRNEFPQPKDPSGPLRSLALPETGDLSEHKALLADGFIAIGIKKGRPSVLLYAEGPKRRAGSQDP